MRVKLNAHGSYKHEFHLVWIPKYRRKVLKRGVKSYVERGINEITTYHPEIEIVKYNVQIDHVHLIIDIPPKYSIALMVGKIKQNTSRKIRERFEWLNKVYKPGVFWSPGYFSSTIGLNEKQILRYVEFQEKVDTHRYQVPLW